MGRWISIDGVETAGKSTLVAHMSRLRPQWAVSSRFSQTRLGDILADGFRTNPYVAQRPAAAQALMVFADFLIRWQEEVKPVVDSGRTVITDRGWLSKLVYQAVILEVGQEPLLNFDGHFAESVMSRVPKPDLTVLLLPSPETIFERLARAGASVTGHRKEMVRRLLNRFEEAAALVDPLIVVQDDETPEEAAVRILNDLEPTRAPDDSVKIAMA